MGILFAKWPPAAILDDQKSLSIAFLAISDQYATFFFGLFFKKWPPAAILEVPFGTFWMTENHFRSHFSPFQINTQLFFCDFFFKMAAGRHFGSPFWDILDDRKSLSISFLAISDQYATFYLFFFFFISRHFRSICNFFFFFFFFSKWPPAAILEVRFAPKTIGFFHYVLSMPMPNMKLIGEFVTQLEMPQAF